MSLLGTPLGFKPSGIGPEQGRRLVVVLHGWLGTPIDDVVQAARDAYSPEIDLVQAARDAYSLKIDLYVPQLDYGKFFPIKREHHSRILAS
jgi:hypothetical protein